MRNPELDCKTAEVMNTLFYCRLNCVVTRSLVLQLIVLCCRFLIQDKHIEVVAYASD